MSDRPGFMPDGTIDPVVPGARRAMSTSERLAASVFVGDGLARSLDEGRLRVQQAPGGFPAEPGYNPYRDEQVSRFLDNNPSLASSFYRSNSPAESALIIEARERNARRAGALARADDAPFTDLLAGLVSPTNIATLPLGPGGRLMAASRLGRIAESAALNAGAAAAIEVGIEVAGGDRDLPGQYRTDLLDRVAMSALFAGSLGGAFGAFSARSLDALGERQRAADGGAAPVAPAAPPAGSFADEPRLSPGRDAPAREQEGLSALEAARRDGDLMAEAQALEQWMLAFVERKRSEGSTAGDRHFRSGDYDRGMARVLRENTDEIPEIVRDTMRHDRWLARDAETGEQLYAFDMGRTDVIGGDQWHGTHVFNIREAAFQAGLRDTEVHDGQRWLNIEPSTGTKLSAAATAPQPNFIFPQRFVELERELRRLVGREADLQVDTAMGVDSGMAWGGIVRLAFDSWEPPAQAGGGTVRHEAIHALRQLGKITEDEWMVLRSAAVREGWLKRFDIERQWGDAYANVDPARRAEMMLEEAVAERFRVFREDRQARGAVARILGKILDFAESVLNWARERGFQSANDVLRAIDEGRVAQRAPAPERTPTPASKAEANEKIDRRVAMFDQATSDDAVFRTADELAEWLNEGDPSLDWYVPAVKAGQQEAQAFAPPLETGPDGDIMFSMPKGPPPSPREKASEIESTGIRVERTRWSQMPYLLLKNNRFEGSLGAALREMADMIVQIPGLRMSGNLSGQASVTDSVQALARQWTPYYVDALSAHDAAWFKLNGWDPANATPGRARLAELKEQVGNAIMGPTLGKITAAEFDHLVGLATATGETPRHNGRLVPEAKEAADAWRAFYDRIEEAGGKAGIILTPRTLDDAEQTIRGEVLRRNQLGREVEAWFTRPENREQNPAFLQMAGLHAQLLEENVKAAGRLATIKELRATTKADSKPYMTHVWKENVVRRTRDDLVKVVADWWRQPPNGSPEGTQWANAQVRAEIAVSHQLKEDPSDTLERALYGHYIDRGLLPADASARAKAESAETRALEQSIKPSEWGREARSIYQQRAQPPKALPLHEQVEAALTRAGVATQDMERLVMEVMGRSGQQADELWTDHARPGWAKARTIDLPTEVLAPWLDLSPKVSAMGYTRKMGAAIEMSRKFGDPNAVLAIERQQFEMLKQVGEGKLPVEEAVRQTQAIRDLRDHVLGNFAMPEKPDAWSVGFIRFLLNSAVMTQMGRALYTNISDAGRPVMAFGFERAMRMAMQAAVKDREAFTLGAAEAMRAGIGHEVATLERSRELFTMNDVGHDAFWISKVAAQGASLMPFVNLVGPWTQMLQRWSGAIRQSDMIELSLKIRDGVASPEEITTAARLGIGEREARRYADQWEHAGKQKVGQLWIANTEGWTSENLKRQFRAALATEVDNIVTRPGPADLPNFMATPIGRLAFLYKGFSVAYMHRAVMAGLQQRDAAVLSGLFSTVALTWLVQGAPKGENDPNPVLSWERLFSAVERSGVMGVMGDLNQAVEMASGQTVGLRPWLGLNPPVFAKDPNWAQRVGAIAGPGVQPWLYAMWATTSGEASGDQQASAFRRLIWFQNLIWLEGVTRALSTEAGTAMGGRQQ